MRGLTYLFALGSLTLSSMTWAADSAGTEAFAAGTRAFSQQDYLLALAHFQEARAQGLEGPAIHYNLGVCRYKLGDYRDAVAAFRIVAAGYPAMRALAEYNLGLVALKRNQSARARTLFQQALVDSNDEKIIRLARVELQKLAPGNASQDWMTLVDARIGHDDNVSLQDDIGLPTGDSASAFTELFAMLSGPAGSRFRFDGSAYAIRYPDAEAFDQSALRVAGVYQWDWGAWRAEAGPHFNYGTLNGDGYERRLGANLLLRRDLDDQTSISLRYLHDEIAELDSRFAFVGGSRDQLRIAIDRRRNNSRIGLGYVLDLNDRQGPSVSPTRHRVFGRYRHSVAPGWLIDVELSYRISSYNDLPMTRDEDLIELSAGFLRTLAKGWQLSGEYYFADNDSNADTFAYDRSRFLLGVTKLF